MVEWSISDTSLKPGAVLEMHHCSLPPLAMAEPGRAGTHTYFTDEETEAQEG